MFRPRHAPRFATSFVVLLLGLCASACGASFSLDRPSDFLELDRGASRQSGYAFRATSAEGVVVAVREIENRGHGSLAFWTEAIRNQLRFGSGYAVTEEVPVRAASGEAGVRMIGGRDQGGRTFAYWVTIFVADDAIYVVEAGGERESFERSRPAIEASLGGFRIR